MRFTFSPFYLRNELVRQDLREGQAGTPLYLDVGVLDITTCQPAKNVFFEIWSCNSQGQYAGFGGSTVGFPPSASGGVPPTGSFSFPFPTGTGFPGPGGPEGFPSPPKTDAYNFLRGGYMTNDNGIVELYVGLNLFMMLKFIRSSLNRLYRPFTPVSVSGLDHYDPTTDSQCSDSGRTVHIHTVIHQNITVMTNGYVLLTLMFFSNN